MVELDVGRVVSDLLETGLTLLLERALGREGKF